MATNQNMFVDQAVMVQAFMQEVGAQVEVLPLDKSTLFDRVYVRKAFKGKPELFHAALEDWGSSELAMSGVSAEWDSSEVPQKNRPARGAGLFNLNSIQS